MRAEQHISKKLGTWLFERRLNLFDCFTIIIIVSTMIGTGANIALSLVVFIIMLGASVAGESARARGSK